MLNFYSIKYFFVFHFNFRFSLQYFNLFPSPFEWVHEENESRTPKLIDSIQSVEIVECCYNFLQKESNVFRKKWKWSKFISHFIKMKDANVQWYVKLRNRLI